MAATGSTVTPITPRLLRAMPLPGCSDVEGKDDRGRVLVVGGSDEIAGAVALSGIAALRTGAGKLQLATAKSAAPALMVAVPEARVFGLDADESGHLADVPEKLAEASRRTDALVLGPGMESSPQATSFASTLLRESDAPCVLDAGALAAFETPRTAPLILTPHAGEMAELTSRPREEITAHAAGIARDFALSTQTVMVLKGPATHVAGRDGRVWRHYSECPGLATSGSGDVLAGVIGALLARGCTPEQAAIWGVWLHARAGRRVASKIGRLGFLAREVSEEIPRLLMRFG
ncbi:NAD(P)H-hydrate dehydratase [Lysobacter auxotrophicus]|uniref:ADP-dependent (S)-NAD(P)H-hydrate dehydratase n=1 Tax=Lysobacter auxotrophicus TaxID=2992573 RepID=A0ABM8DD07_9GAMM|nr:NAD(P)H-hydrate dehydratase [Lysobacter auxotrophicus]BDU16481.1 NAD(P)H-hydrate dehydratase [Lysobacter auxotrophicus]